MGNESFDKKVKDKFDQFEPAFQEQDWQDFSPLLRAQSVWWNRSRKAMAYSAAIAAVLLLTFQNFNLSIENKTLQSKIDKIKEIPIETTGKKVVSSPDTVYIVREKVVYVQAPAVVEQINSEETLITPQKKPVSTEITKSKVILDKASNLQAAQDNSAIEIVGEQHYQVEKTPATTDKNGIERVASLPLTPIDTKAISNSVSSNKKIQIEKVEKDIQQPNLLAKVPKSGNNNIAIGLGSSIRDDYSAVGVSALFTFRKHFQLSTGLQYGRGHHEEFRNNDDFKERHKVDFKNKFNQPIAPNVKFTDIKSNTRQWVIPISLNYKFPIYRFVGAYAGLGTFFEFNTSQNYAFQYSENGNMPLKGSLPVKQSGVNLSKFTMLAGMQADIRSFCIRIEPTVLFDTKNNFGEHRKHFLMGLNGQILYRF